MGDGSQVYCRMSVECDAHFPNHRWGRIKAHSEGWYEGKDGHAYCPQHVPDWVKTWRRKKEKK